MKGVKLIDPKELFNLLNQNIINKSCLNDENYLIFYDTRKQEEYSESHIVLSFHTSIDDQGFYKFPYNIDHSSIKHIVVMDNQTLSLKDNSSSGACCAENIWTMMSKNQVKLVKGGFKVFSALYPFLCTKKILYTQQDISRLTIYPLEIESGFLFLGTTKQAFDKNINYNLKIKAHVNVTMEYDTFFPTTDLVMGIEEDSITQFLHIPVKDEVGENIYKYFPAACSFIKVTIVLCYLIFSHKITLKEAFNVIKTCHFTPCPHQEFIRSLLKWELDVLGESVTIPDELTIG